MKREMLFLTGAAAATAGVLAVSGCGGNSKESTQAPTDTENTPALTVEVVNDSTALVDRAGVVGGSDAPAKEKLDVVYTYDDPVLAITYGYDQVKRFQDVRQIVRYCRERNLEQFQTLFNDDGEAVSHTNPVVTKGAKVCTDRKLIPSMDYPKLPLDQGSITVYLPGDTPGPQFRGMIGG